MDIQLVANFDGFVDLREPGLRRPAVYRCCSRPMDLTVGTSTSRGQAYGGTEGTPACRRQCILAELCPPFAPLRAVDALRADCTVAGVGREFLSRVFIRVYSYRACTLGSTSVQKGACSRPQ